MNTHNVLFAAALAPVAEVVAPEVVATEAVPEVVAVDAVLPTVVGKRSNSALDATALDAAQGLSGPARTQARSAGRRRGGKPGHR